jgi:ribosomal protein L33
MESKRDLNFEVNNSDDLNKMLTGVLMDVRRGVLNHEMAKGITLVADKINRNNVNKLEYKKVCKHNKKIDFFEKE